MSDSDDQDVRKVMDALDSYVKNVVHGFIVGFVIIAVGAALLSALFIRAHSNLERDYLRIYIAKSKKYKPCENAGFDWAMGVDCKTLRVAQGFEDKGVLER